MELIKGPRGRRVIRYDSRPIPDSWIADPANKGLGKTLTRREWADLIKSIEQANRKHRTNK